MSGYKPTTDEVREAYQEWAWSRRMWRSELEQEDGGEFDRWLAAVERAAAEKALTDAAEQFATQDGIETLFLVESDVEAVEEVEKWLLDRAAALGLTAGQEGESDGE